MPAAVRGRGTLVAIGYPIAAFLAIALWIDLYGTQVTTSALAVVVLVRVHATGLQPGLEGAARSR